MENQENLNIRASSEFDKEMKEKTTEAVSAGLASPTAESLNDPDVRRAYVEYMSGLSTEELEQSISDLEASKNELEEVFTNFRDSQTLENRARVTLAMKNALTSLPFIGGAGVVGSIGGALTSMFAQDPELASVSTLGLYVSFAALFSGRFVGDTNDVLNNATPEISEKRRILLRAHSNIEAISQILQSQRDILLPKQ